jgi:CubicO group peptidase (beta-lactamase class C family)
MHSPLPLLTGSIILLLLLSLPTSVSAQSVGIDQEKLELLLTVCAESKADKVLIFHQNEQIAFWENPTCDSAYMNTASMVKSWVPLGVGILLEEGLISSVDDPVCTYLPEWKSGCENSVTIRHLLTMSSGLLKRPVGASALVQKDINSFVLQLQTDTLAGVRWSYSNEGVQLLGILIEKVSGKTVGDFFAESFFEPLGMDSTSFYADEAGNEIIFGGCKTTVQDASKMGLLMLNQGKFKGHQILPARWVEEIITPAATNEYYGMLWWLDQANNNYAAMGDFGQMTIVFPEKELVFIRQQSCGNQDRSQNMNWMGPAFLEMLGSIVTGE